MTLSLYYTGAPDGDDGPFDFVPASAWGLLAGHAVTLPPERFPSLRELVETGKVTGTDRLSEEIRGFAPGDGNVAAVLDALRRTLGVGDPSETVLVLGDDDADPRELLTGNFDPDQARDEGGRWSLGGALGGVLKGLGLGGGGAVATGGTGAKGQPVPREPRAFAAAVQSSKAYQAFRTKVVGYKEKVYDEAARAAGVPRDTFLREVKEKAQALVDRQDVYVRVKEAVLDRILEDGRFKNVAEIPGISKGFKDLRARGEEDGMGVARDTPADQRPISGYLGEPHFGSTRGEPAGEGKFNYGNAVIRLRESVKDRSTVTFDDSGSVLNIARMVASPLRDVDPYSVSSDHVRAHGTGVLKDLKTYQDTTKLYVEAQVHGGLRTEDIHEVGFDKTPDVGLQQRLAAKGIGWRVY